MLPFPKPDLSKLNLYQKKAFPGRPTLVFLHDSLGSIELWRDFPEQLAEQAGCNLLVYDRQGYGRSCGFSEPERGLDYMEKEARILYDLLVHLQVEKPILFGHSDGGSIALLAAALFPESILGLITVGAHVYVEEITLAGIREAMQAFEETDLPQRLRKYHGDNTEAMFRAWAETWTRPDFRNWNIEARLSAVRCPALILQGENDEFGSARQVEDIVRQVSGPVESVLFPGLKHNPHKEAPALVIASVLSFLKKSGWMDALPGDFL